MNLNFDENLADFGCGIDDGTMSKNGAAFLKCYARTSTVSKLIGEAETRDKKKEIIRKYLDFCYCCENDRIKGARNPVEICINGPNFESITRSKLPDIAQECCSTLYLVEFFTHCCINCIHSIEDVREVHEEMESLSWEWSSEGKSGFQGMKVLSIHSPKFPREKDVASIKSFCKKMRMEHSEVINDPECTLWNELGVTCWPTLLIMGPNPFGGGPNLLFNFMGEGHKEELLIAIKTAMEYFGDKLTAETITNGKLTTNNDYSEVDGNFLSEERNILRFPGKVATLRDRILVADSGNNRIIILNENGQVQSIIGGVRRGNRDGHYNEAMFYNPQGIALMNDSIFYVADTGNHAIRQVDLKKKLVSTLIKSSHSLIVNDEQLTLKSPWDLCFYDPNILIIAAAGNHQLFGYFFSDVTLFGVEHKQNTFALVAGSGREENRNNSYILKASFAQPSGITVMENSDEKSIFIADSESSSVRAINSKGQVVAVVGASRDPTDLFAFGDADGKGVIAKLQHPMGVCNGVVPTEIFVADTYNHKIKKIDIPSKICNTFISNNLNEPSGVCLSPDKKHLYVADTNNHSIKRIDLQTGTTTDVKVLLDASVTDSPQLTTEKYYKCYEVRIPSRKSSNEIKFKISPLPDTYEGGQWKIISDSSATFHNTRGEVNLIEDKNVGEFTFMVENMQSESASFTLLLDIFFCGPNSCLKRTRKIKITCVEGANDIVQFPLTLEWNDIELDV